MYSSMDRRIGWVVLGVVVVGIAAAVYFYYPRESPGEPPAAQTELPPPAEPVPETGIEHPVPEAPPAQEPSEPLPLLTESDQPVRHSLEETVGDAPVEKFLVPDDVVRRFVATVDNLPRKKVAVRLRPVKPLEGQTIVEGDADLGETVTLSEKNYARYEPMIQVLRSTDAKQLETLYLRYYPLLQQAYEDLGYPDEYFNDRMVAVIDHLLETPEVRGPIELVRPKVFYEFADPKLEARSAGQKALIRMGPQNAAVVKQKLQELRALIATGEEGQSR